MTLKGNYSFEIPPQFVDFQQKVKLSSLVDLILTASGYNADDNGFGIRNLNELNATWVLSRIALEVSHFPKQYEKIRIETWVEEVHSLNTIRNYRVFDSDENVICNATSVWVMISLETRRPIELKKLEGLKDFETFEESGIERTMKLNVVDNEPIYQFPVQYSHIDINQHVNTVRYLDWMIDTFSLDEHKSHSISRVDVNFMSEILFGQKVEVFKMEEVSDIYRFELRANGRTACRGRIKWG